MLYFVAEVKVSNRPVAVVEARASATHHIDMSTMYRSAIAAALLVTPLLDATAQVNPPLPVIIEVTQDVPVKTSERHAKLLIRRQKAK